ncbi:MAG: prepilin-type N-terminal cleavage/methylation domain-containing protein [Cyanobacteria bacterium P01_A01_bin.17]
MIPIQTNVRRPKLRPWLERCFIDLAYAGFTLPELLIATAITSIVIAVAFSGLLTITEANNKAEDQIDRRRELNRALDFIADDVREATLISETVPPGWTDMPSSPYTPIFYLLKPPQAGGPQQAVGYYVRSAGGVVWRGPLVVYRLQPSGTDLAAQNFPNIGANGRALVDAITATSPNCLPLTGASAVGQPNVGLKVFIADDQTAKVCLAGQLDDTDSLSLETQVFTRGRT